MYVSKNLFVQSKGLGKDYKKRTINFFYQIFKYPFQRSDLKIDYPENFVGYFKKSYYAHFGPLPICVELFVTAIYLFIGHKKSNFALALFAFTAFFLI
jgi:hypothetical protein